MIIITTVRSSADHVGHDIKHKLGFVAAPKRFNVAVSRAKALLIIVGNPHVLVTDPHWARLLRWARDHGAYRGIPYPEEAAQGEQAEAEEDDDQWSHVDLMAGQSSSSE